MIDLCELGALPAAGAARLFRRGDRRPAARCDLCTGEAALYDATIDAQKAALGGRAHRRSASAPAISPILLVGEATEAIAPPRPRPAEDVRRRAGAQPPRLDGDRPPALRGRRARRGERGAWRLSPHRERRGHPVRTRNDHAARSAEPLPRRRDRRDARRAARGRPRRARRPRRRRSSSSCGRSAIDLAKAEGIAAYMVFADRTLIEMAQLRPATPRRAARDPRRRRAQARPLWRGLSAGNRRRTT